MRLQRYHALSALLIAAGMAIAAGCTNDSNAQSAARDRALPADTAGIGGLLTVVRGASPLVCEMATRTVDTRGWSSWGEFGDDPLTMDSGAAAFLNGMRHAHHDPAGVPVLVAGMQDDDACVRRVAGSLLARVKHPTAVRALLAALGDQKAGTREAAAFGLGMAEVPAGVDPLVALLRDGTPGVRRAAAWSLGQMEARKAVPTLIELVTRDPDARVRQTAAWAIGSIH